MTNKVISSNYTSLMKIAIMVIYKWQAGQLSTTAGGKMVFGTSTVNRRYPV